MKAIRRRRRVGYQPCRHEQHGRQRPRDSHRRHHSVDDLRSGQADEARCRQGLVCLGLGDHVSTYLLIYALPVGIHPLINPSSGIISGLNYVASDWPTRGCANGVVAALTFGGGFSTAINTAARNLVQSGIFVAAGVGSSGSVINSSPASEPSVCAVGATTSADAVAAFNDYGPLLDIFAPGVNILSTWNTNTGTVSRFGKSGVVRTCR